MRISSLYPILFPCFLLFPLLLSAQSPDDYWDDRFDLPGLEAAIYNSTFDADGNLYVRGEIWSAGGLPGRTRMRMWDGGKWNATGAFSDTLVVQGKALSVNDDRPVAAVGNMIYTIAENFEPQGRTTHEEYLIRWDGNGWSLAREGVRGGIAGLCVHASGVYIAGNFTVIGDTTIRGIARWDGGRWHDVGGGTGGHVQNLAVDRNGTVYISGHITEAGGMEITTNSARWDGAEWREFGDRELQKELYRMTAAGTTIYAGARQHIFRLEGTEWKNISGEIEAAYDFSTGIFSGDRLGSLYISAFSRTETESPSRILRLSGSAWEELPHRFNGSLTSLVFGGGDTFALLGNFQVVNDSLIAIGGALWDGAAWRAFDAGREDQGLVGSVAGIEIRNGYLYAGGTKLRTPGLTGTHGILRWSDRNGWEKVGGGIEGRVNRIIRNRDGDLLAVGCFGRAGNGNARNIARWDGAEWHPVGEGPDLCPVDLAVAGDTIYAVAGAVLMQWNGTGWKHLDSVRNGQIRAVAVGPDGSIYVGGRFDSAGEMRVNNIARWKEGRWFSLDDGMKMQNPSYVPFGFDRLAVNALAGDGKFIYAGGMFDSAGTALAFNIARWNGTEWEAMDSGLVGIYPLSIFFNERAVVHTIRTTGTGVYAGGRFYGAGSWSLYSDDTSPRYMGTGGGIAWWDESTGLWNPVGIRSGTPVTGIATDGEQLFIGGAFTRTDDTLRSFGIARRKVVSALLERPVVAETLDFGLVPERRNGVRDLVIANPATSTRTLAGTIEITEGPFGTVREAEFRIAPGFSGTVPLRFSPATTGYFTGKAIIRHNAATDATPTAVQLSGIGIPLDANFTAEPNEIDFGRVVQNPNQTEVDTLFIRNHKNSNSTISFRIEAAPGVPFALDWDYYNNTERATETITLAPGEERIHLIEIKPENPGDFRETLVLSHDGEPGGEVRIPLRVTVLPRFARLNLSPDRIDFGNVPIGSTELDTLRIAADPRSNHPVYLDYSLTHEVLPPFALIKYGISELTPAQTTTLILSFAPHSINTFGDTLLLLQNIDGVIDTLRISVSGRGVEPVIPTAQIQLSGSSLDFGSLARGEEKAMALTVTNPADATAPLVLNITPPAKPFAAQQTAGSTLQPGQSTELTVRFAPTTSGTFNGQLLIGHNAEGTPTPIAVSLQGESRTTSVTNEQEAKEGTAMLRAEPNPASGSTRIRFRTERAGTAALTVYAADGREVARLIDGPMEAGEQNIDWNTAHVEAGVYLCRLKLGEREETYTVVVRR